MPFLQSSPQRLRRRHLDIAPVGINNYSYDLQFPRINPLLRSCTYANKLHSVITINVRIYDTHHATYVRIHYTLHCYNDYDYAAMLRNRKCIIIVKPMTIC